MSRLGRPRSVKRPPCPTCAHEDHVVAHGFHEVDGAQKRIFRCTRCRRTFRPGAKTRRADAAVRAAVRRVRKETGVNYRLLARALGTHLGITVSHATVGSWCRRDGGEDAEPEGAPCEYLSLLWALRQEIEAELDEA